MRFKLSLLAMVTILGVGYGATVAAQQQPQQQAGVQGADMRDNRDGGVDLGWLGLAGLIGLVGLKRADRSRTGLGDAHVSR